MAFTHALTSMVLCHGLIGIEDTPPVVAPVLWHGPRRHLQIPLDGAPAAADLHGDGRRAPALAMQGPHLLIAGLPVRGALGRLLRGTRGRGWRWHGDRQRPIGE